MNEVWNHPAWNGLLFDRARISASAGAAAAAVIVAVLALLLCRAVWGRPAPLRYGLLLTALVVLGIVPAVAAASRVAGWAAMNVPAAIVDRPLAAVPVVAAAAVPKPSRMPGTTIDAEPVRPEPDAEPMAPSLRLPTLREAASGLLWMWLGGVAVAIGLVIRDLVRLRRLVRSLVPCASPAAVGLLAEAARTVGLGRPPLLFESAAVPVPVVIGPVNPQVVLPAGLATTLNQEKLAAVLTHEAAHVVHGDLWVGLLQHAVAAIYWWCPPVHRLNRRLGEVREEICDDYVVLAQGDGFQLAEVLVEMAAGLRGKRERLAIGALGAIDEKPALEGRVERLVDSSRRSIPMTRMNRLAIVAVGAFGLVAVAIVLATTIQAADEPAVAQPPAAEVSPPAAPSVAMTAAELRAIDAALAWIAKRQEDDGGWSLDEPRPMRAAATSLAILPFLARGHDHTTPGPYREQIARGIEFLVTLVGEDGGALKDGETMYSQGLVAMTLCRAYGRTRDPVLEAPAQATLDFIMAAQNPQGSWGYVANNARGDTSILGYQVEALACGEAAGLKVKPETWEGVARFLDSVQGNADGSTYGYSGPGNGPNTSVIGLLARQRTGWQVDQQGLKTGLAKIVAPGPTSEIYTCYHASRLVHVAADADAWADWRSSVADLLIEAQATDGDDAGSWPMQRRMRIEGQPFAYSEIGGPLTKTSLAALTLAEPLDLAVLPPPGKRDALRQAIADTESASNLYKLAFAMVRFNDTHGHLPAAAIQDRAGKPLLSWRVAILPFIDQRDLYEKFRLDEPWDSRHNSKLLERMPDLFASPGKPAGKRGETRYLAPIGPGTIFAARANPWSLVDVSSNDGGAMTILLVEAAADKAVPWTKPVDLAIDADRPLDGLDAARTGGFLAAFADGRVQLIPDTIPARKLYPWLTPDGNEVVDERDLEPTR